MRIERILELIRKCEYSIHDLSMQTLDSDHGLPHFNMPFELGLLIGTVRATQEHASKKFLIFDSEPDRLRLSCSDLKGYDPVHHSGKPDEIIRLTRDWLAEAAERDLYWPKPIIEEFAAFEQALPRIGNRLGLSPDRIGFRDLCFLVRDFINQQRGATLTQSL